MLRRRLFLWPVIACLLAPLAHAGEVSIDIDLTKQKAYLLQDGKAVYETPISSGRPGHRTPTGDFKVLEKDPHHLSSLYGRIVDGSGRTVTGDADSDMHVPSGGKFISAPMKYFLRFDGPNGLHAGILPGYPASHGCVRLPLAKAILFFDCTPVGAPVHIHGEPPSSPQPVAASATPAPAPRPSEHRFLFFSRRMEPAN